VFRPISVPSANSLARDYNDPLRSPSLTLQFAWQGVFSVRDVVLRLGPTARGDDVLEIDLIVRRTRIGPRCAIKFAAQTTLRR